MFTATVMRCAERPAIEAPDASLGYGELAGAAMALAQRLRERGIGPGDRVGVRVPSGTAELYVAILGVLRSGAAYVPVDADEPPARAGEIWSRAGACAAVGAGLAITELAAPARGAERPLTPEDDAWVIFTSGSTGEPKGVAVTHRAAAAFVDAEARLWSIDLEDRVLAGLSVAFDASCEEMWLAWRHGATLIPAARSVVRSGADLGDWIADCGVSVVSTVPTLAAMWDERSLAGVRLLILGGEACPDALGWRLSAEREAWNTYGPTEATVVSTAARIRPGEPVTIGRPLDGWEVAVLGEDDVPVAPGEEGQLVIAGVGLGRYLDEQLDAERYAPVPWLGWERAYRTGDIVRETAAGLQFVGRRDGQVKLGGRRIELGEIDAAVGRVPGVSAAATVVRSSEAGTRLLVSYVAGDAPAEAIRSSLAERLPAGISPLIVALDELPRTRSGKLDRGALPWPPPDAPGADGAAGAPELTGASAWLAERWCEQLGPHRLTDESDFFELGGSSLAAAKLISRLRERFPAVAVADVYRHRRLGELAQALEQLGAADAPQPGQRRAPGRRWGLAQLAGVLALIVLGSPPWLLGVLALNRLEGAGLGPQLGWGWLIGGWLLLVSVPGRSLLLIATRRILLAGLRPGRYRRHSWLTLRIWLAERLAAGWRLERLEGTPWAARYARLCGHHVGRGTRLFTLPPIASLVEIGDGATVEAAVDIDGWWIEGDELVVGAIRVGARARVGTLSVLMPGADVGEGAELEPGTVVGGRVPAGERWEGSPGRRAGTAGEHWPRRSAPRPERARLWKAMYAAGIAISNLLPLAAALPGLGLLLLSGSGRWTAGALAGRAIAAAPLLVLAFSVAYALLVAALVRGASPLIRPGWHPEDGATRWALWFTDLLTGGTLGVLFPLYASVYTRAWLRLLGIRVGRRAEVSVVSGLNRLTSLSRASFCADAAAFAVARSRAGWLHVGPIEVGSSFVGNGAILEGGTRIGDQSLVGVLSTAPRGIPDRTSWFGSPALELPRRPDPADPARTVDPPRRLVAARGAVELVRILGPASISLILGSLVFDVLEQIGTGAGVAGMALAGAPLLLAAGVSATAITIALKWLVIGRYRSGEHPLWSFFVWRDELINTCQEQLAGAWLIGTALATPLMSAYLRLMGTRVGRDVWCETMTITEFDMVTLGDGCAINRHAIVEAHLFHDRLLRIGPVVLGPGCTVGPVTAVLPETELGESCCVGARSVVMRGERLPALTRWHGAPVVASEPVAAPPAAPAAPSPRQRAEGGEPEPMLRLAQPRLLDAAAPG